MTRISDTMDKKVNQDPKNSTFRQSLPQILAVCVKNVLLLIHGMSLGFPTILIPGVSGNDAAEPIILDLEEISWIGSINLIFVPIGCIMSGVITQAIGRKRAMQVVNVPFLAAWLLFYFSQKSWHIFLAACMLGTSGGLLEAPVLTYVAEITQPHLRGILSSSSTMTVTLGILSQFILGTVINWRTVTLVNSTIPIIACILLMFVPETPVWLISKNRTDEAQKSIAWLRGWTTVQNIQEEYNELYNQVKVNNNIGVPLSTAIMNKIKNFKLYVRRNFIWPSMLIALTFILGHFNGLSPFQVYAIKIFKALKAPLNAYYSTILVGVVQLLGTTVSVALIHVLGKRILNFISLFGSGVCLLIVATYAYIHKINTLEISKVVEESSEADEYSWIPVTLLIMFSFLSYLGIKILPWILIGEIFAVEIRATASGVSAGVGYIFGFICNKTFLNMVDQFSFPVVFGFYGTVGVVGTVLLYFTLPETEGKTLFEITEHFAGRKKLRNSVRRGFKNINGVKNPAFEDEENQNNKIESKL